MRVFLTLLALALCVATVSATAAPTSLSESDYQFLFTQWIAQWQKVGFLPHFKHMFIVHRQTFRGRAAK